MQLIGYLDSPFVRRVALSMRFLGIAYEHRELSIFRNYDEFRQIHPAVKVPTLVCEDGTALIDSTLILNYLEQHVANRSLMPSDKAEFQQATYNLGLALVAMEKVAQLIYETGHRPAERQHGPWIDRIEQQLAGAVGLMESSVAAAAQAGNDWLMGNKLNQADISTAVAWRFTQHIDRVSFGPEDYPALAAYSARAEELPEFKACPLSG